MESFRNASKETNPLRGTDVCELIRELCPYVERYAANRKRAINRLLKVFDLVYRTLKINKLT